MPHGHDPEGASDMLAALARIHKSQDLEISRFLHLVRRIETDMEAINTRLAAFTARMRAPSEPWPRPSETSAR